MCNKNQAKANYLMIKPRNACSSSAPSNGGDSKQEGCPIGKYIPIYLRLKAQRATPEACRTHRNPNLENNALIAIRLVHVPLESRTRGEE
jgi:hypothetical protein